MIGFKDAELERQLQNKCSDRLSPGLVAKRDLERYYAVLAHAERSLNFTNAELNAIYDCCNGTIFEPALSDPGIVCNVQDSLINELADKWDIDGDALVTKLHALNPVQSWALVDKIERYFGQS